MAPGGVAKSQDSYCYRNWWYRLCIYIYVLQCCPHSVGGSVAVKAYSLIYFAIFSCRLPCHPRVEYTLREWRQGKGYISESARNNVHNYFIRK